MGTAGLGLEVRMDTDPGAKGHRVCLAAQLSWPGTDRLTAGCSPSGRTQVNVHPVTVKWPEDIRAVLLGETLTYKAI